MFQKKQKLLLILTSFLLLFACFSFVFALETEYPDAGGDKITETTTFSQYVRYLFNFSIALAGIIAFGVMVFSGIKIITSPDQPETVKDARTKIIGAFLGIIILLSSYLILTTLNPQLSVLDLKEIKPTSGVYLTDDKGKDHYIADSSTDVGFNATAVKFISSSAELLAVYDASENKVDNTGVGSGGAFSGRSIYFLWNKPGIYLYPKLNFLGKPQYFNTSVSALSNYNFDKKTKSIKFIKGNLPYGAIFFTESDFRGQCGFLSVGEEITDMSSTGYTHPIGNIDGGLSSFILLKYQPPTSTVTTGNVVFYDGPNCTGHSKEEIASPVSFNPQYDLTNIFFDSTSIPEKDHIASFKINGSFGVLLTTKKSVEGKCQFFTKPSADNCYPSIQSSYLWEDWWLLGPSVGTWVIVPLSE